MITRKNLDKLYDWARDKSFPLKKAPTSTHYSNKDIYICGLKFVCKNTNIKKNLMSEEIYIINRLILYNPYDSCIFSRFYC